MGRKCGRGGCQRPKLPRQEHEARRSFYFLAWKFWELRIGRYLGVVELRRCGVGRRQIPKAKTGATVAPVFGRTGRVTASCRPSSSRPLQPSSPCVYPPFRVGFVREEPFFVSQRRCHPARRRCVHTPVPSIVCHRIGWPKKSGVQRCHHTPSRSAALSASCRPFSCRPLQLSSPSVPPSERGCPANLSTLGLQQVG
jgi:hypothetical protein